MKQRDFTSQEKKYYKGSISILSFLQPTNPHYSALPAQVICLIPRFWQHWSNHHVDPVYLCETTYLLFAEDNGSDDSMEVFWWVKYGHI